MFTHAVHMAAIDKKFTHTFKLTAENISNNLHLYQFQLTLTNLLCESGSH